MHSHTSTARRATSPWLLLTLWFAVALAPACTTPEPDDAAPITRATSKRPYIAADGRAAIFFTRPGTSPETGEDPEIDDAVIAAIRDAQTSIDLCLYELSFAPIVDAVAEAVQRGVQVRMVGDGDEVHDLGYEALDALGVPIVARPAGNRIMHNKFIIIDDATLFTGSMNYTDNGILKNNNHTIRFDDAALAAIYKAEFEQMFQQASFGRQKSTLGITQSAPLGDTVADVFFSPQDDVDAQVIAHLKRADVRVFFMIFSFTHEGISQELQRLHTSGVQVTGVFDVSQARGRYSQDEALAQAGLPVLLDGNEHTQGFAGGKLHHKVMIIDAGTDSEPTVLIGSYNWSKSATEDNDENLMVLRGAELVTPFVEEFCRVFSEGTPHPELIVDVPDPCAGLTTPVRINELMPNPDGADADEEWVELVNTGDAPVSLAGWTLGDALNARRHVFGEDVVLAPKDALVVYSGPNPAQSRPHIASSGQLSINNNVEVVTLRDARGTVVDQVTVEGAPSGVSFNRVVDGGRGDALALHDTLAAAPASPGTRADGSPWGLPPRVIINEVYPDPIGTEAGQEYVELVNLSDAPVDLLGWRLSDAVRERHTFSTPYTLGPGQALVLFDTGDHSAIPNAITSSTGQLGLNNTGDTLTLQDPLGRVADTATYTTTTEGVSLNRATDGDASAPLIDHNTLTGLPSPTSASPGTRASGAAWGASGSPRVIIHELMPNPLGADTGNEYVTLLNTGDAPAQLQGWRLADAVGDRHTFLNPLELAPGASITIFDRGDHNAPNTILSSTRSLSLNNTGDHITLYDASGATRDALIYQSCEEGVALRR